MKTRLLPLAVLFSLCLTACKKDDTGPYFPEGKVPAETLVFTGREGLLPSVWTEVLIMKSEYQTTYHRTDREFKYDEKNRIVSILERDDMEHVPSVIENGTRTSVTWQPSIWEYRYTYHERGYLIREDVSWNDEPLRTVYYGYEDGTVWVKEVRSKSSPNVNRIHFDSEGRISRKTTASGWDEVFVYDPHGNISYFGSTNGSKYNLDYDDKNGIFSVCNSPHWYLATNGFYGYLQNNKETEFYGNSTFPVLYEYNEQEYPVAYHIIQGDHFEKQYTVAYIPAKVF